jgi:hypothetical protein
MISLTDSQLFYIQEAAKNLPPENRSLFLERLAAHLEKRRGGLFIDNDVAVAAKIAVAGLVHHDPAA